MHSRAWLWLQVLTVARVPLTIVVAALLCTLEPSSSVVLVCAGFLLAAELTDALDGFIARRFGLASEVGAMLDPWADSISRLVVYWSLACAGLANVLVPLVMAVRDITVSYCRITWIRQGRSVGARLSGKLKAIVQAGAAFALLSGPLCSEATRPWVREAFSWTVIVITVYSGIDYLLSSKRADKANDGDATAQDADSKSANSA